MPHELPPRIQLQVSCRLTPQELTKSMKELRQQEKDTPDPVPSLGSPVSCLTNCSAYSVRAF